MLCCIIFLCSNVVSIQGHEISVFLLHEILWEQEGKQEGRANLHYRKTIQHWKQLA